MAKLRKDFALAKRLPGPSQMDRVRAARSILHSRIGTEALALVGFMAIFHPGYPEDKVRELASDVRERERGRY